MVNQTNWKGGSHCITQNNKWIQHLFENNLTLWPRITALRWIFLGLISMFINHFVSCFHISCFHKKSCDAFMYVRDVSCPSHSFITFATIFSHIFFFLNVFLHFLAFFTVFFICTCTEYGKISNVWNIPNFNLWWLDTFTYVIFSKNDTFIKVDVFPFLTFSSSLGLPITCEFEEWKKLVHLLVGKPTHTKLHRVKPNR